MEAKVTISDQALCRQIPAAIGGASAAGATSISL
jgi:hypothetical protein